MSPEAKTKLAVDPNLSTLAVIKDMLQAPIARMAAEPEWRHFCII
jgi:hypothetical protein